MQTTLQSVLTEVGIAATIGAGYFMWKNRPIERSGESDYLKNSNFSFILDKFKNLEQNHQFDLLKSEVELFLILYDQIEKKEAPSGSQFQLNRIYNSILTRSKQMCIEARRSKNSDVLITAIDCERDEIDNLSAECENILRNALLM